MFTRAVRNLIRLPQRTTASLVRVVQPQSRIQRAADRYAREQLSPQQLADLGSVPGNTSDRKCRLLFYLASTTPAKGHIVEIGAFKGKSTAWLAEAARRSGRPMTSIDPHLLDSYDEFQRTVEWFDIKSVATLYRALSHDIGKDWSDPIAFLWIDGGHDYECVKQDILDFMPHVQAGGIVVFDDAVQSDFPGVVRAINELVRPDPAFKDMGQIKSFGLFRKTA